MAFQRLRSSAWARGSPLRSAKASSRSSLRWLSSRSTVSEPSSSAPRTAHPGSPWWRQSRKRQAAGQRVDVVERRVDALVRAGDLERADAGRVDEQGAARQDEQLAVGRRVAAARVVVADRGGRLAFLAEQGVDQRGLADAGRAEHDRRSPGPQVLAEVRDVVAGQRAQDDDGHAGGDAPDGDEPPLQVVGDVGLVEDDDRVHAARPGDREIALQPAQVEVVVEARDDERHVDVGCDDLLVGEVTGAAPARVRGAAHERRLARQDRGDDRRIVGPGLGAGGFERHPVPDGRVVRRGESVIAEAAGHDRRAVVAVRTADDGRVLVHRDHPGRPAAAACDGRGAVRVIGPAERGKVEHRGHPTRLSLPVRLA